MISRHNEVDTSWLSSAAASLSCELEESEFIAQPWTILGGNISISLSLPSWNIKMICNIIWIYDLLSMFQFERFEESR